MGEMQDVPSGPLRHGYTTGACATACAKAALTALIHQRVVEEVTIWIPAGQWVTFQVHDVRIGESEAHAATIKDGGDDPDATHGATIMATVSWSNEAGVEIDGGIGVGRVTKPGLPIPVGLAAINPVPRQMIRSTVESLLAQSGIEHGVKVLISVPEGEEIAKRTMNARLGILGGISILGTRGIVVPFSTSSYKASIAYAMNVAREQGIRVIVLTTGGRSEKYAMRMFSDLPQEAFVEMGDFVGFSALQAKRVGMEQVRFVGMVGKFSKVAQGVMMVHAKSAPVDFAFLADLARRSGGSDDLARQIAAANTANQAADLAVKDGCTAFFENMARLCCEQIREQVRGGIGVETHLTTLDGEYLGGARLGE